MTDRFNTWRTHTHARADTHALNTNYSAGQLEEEESSKVEWKRDVWNEKAVGVENRNTVKPVCPDKV